MDRLTQLRGDAGGSRDSTQESTSHLNETYMSANEGSSKYFSLSEVDSSFDITPIKDVSLASAAAPDKPASGTDDLISDLSPIPKKSDLLDSYKFGKEIEAANILSGGVDIFDDNDNSYDGNELVIDDNVDIDDKSSSEIKVSENTVLPFQKSDEITETNLVEQEQTITGRDTEVVLQIDGKNVNAIDIGNGLYLYRKEGEEELAAVQINDDGQPQPSYKFLKVRENTEGNLEVYEEIEVEVPRKVPVKETELVQKNALHVPIKDINKVIIDPVCSKVAEKKVKAPQEETLPTTSTSELVTDSKTDSEIETKVEVNVNGKIMTFNETRKSPVIHSTPNKEGIPLTKTMVDLQLHPARHSDKVKTIEVHTDSCKQRLDTGSKNDGKTPEVKEYNVTNEKLDIILDQNQVKNSEKNCLAEPKMKNVETSNANNTAELRLVTTKPTSDENTGLGKVLNENKEKELKEKKEDKLREFKEGIVKSNKKVNDLLNSKQVESHEEITDKSNSSTSKMETENSNLVGKVNIKESDVVINVIPNKIVCTKDTKVSEVEKLNDSIIEDKNKEIGGKEEILNTNKQSDGSNTNIQNNGPKDEAERRGENFDRTDIIHVSDKPKRSSDNVRVQSTIVQKIQIEHVPIVTNVIHQLSTVKKGSINTISDAPAEITGKTNVDQVNKIDNLEVKEQEPDSKLKQISPRKEENVLKIEQALSKKAIISCPAQPNDDTKLNISMIKAIDKSVDPNKKEVPNTNMITNVTQNKTEVKKEVTKPHSNLDQKPINNNHAPVPFGKWTEANRQDFLNKIKETKTPSNSINPNSTNTKQLKQANDLNRRDVLQKIDSQRQSINATAKLQESSAIRKLNVKKETKTFASKPAVNQESKIPVNIIEVAVDKNKLTLHKKATKPEIVQKTSMEQPVNTISTSSVAKKESLKRKEINNQDLIDKTIEDIINRAGTGKPQDDTKQTVGTATSNAPKEPSQQHSGQSRVKSPGNLDEIEMKMNELHGIPFVERPPHELPQLYAQDIKSYAIPENLKATAIKTNKEPPSLLPFTNKTQQKIVKENDVEIDSEEEIIGHEPITGDIELNKVKIATKFPTKLPIPSTVVKHIIADPPKKEAIITEKDFDKFARRNSITYENCLTLNYEGSEPHNVIQTVVEKDIPAKKYSRNEILLAEAKVKSSQKHQALHSQKHALHSNSHQIQITSKLVPVSEDTLKNYQSKVQIAYQSALTAKRQMESPITIIDDKPVKVVFMDSNTEYTPSPLNVQGLNLSPAKRQSDAITVSIGDSLDSDVFDAIDDKSQDEAKAKTKHQRKQVLTPVDTPELELIEPSDLGIEVLPKKKRRTEDNRAEKSSRNIVPKKSYLLGRSAIVEEAAKPQDLSENTLKETINQNNIVVSHKDAASAIDNLVKAAELLETQSENLTSSTLNSDNSLQNTPVKRGRGRPRKYPLPEGAVDKTKVPSPEKKPRLIDAKERKLDTDEDDTSDEEMIKENWTMGKINENIVCPICGKLFRSENVVFKHVKHCTGPSPNRSDSDKRSPRRSRLSLESDSKSRESQYDDMNFEIDKPISNKDTLKKRKSNNIPVQSTSDKEDLIVIEEKPLKERIEKLDEPKPHKSREATTKTKVQQGADNLKCEICGKLFRQLSYLVSHKLQHKKEEPKKPTCDVQSAKSGFSCEICGKEFRKLHHLVQHRLIHNPSISSRTSRKSSSEQSEIKVAKDQDLSKQRIDQSAAFRCEPCDKSFRKLHHLVEHRETHGINRQKSNSNTQTNIDKSSAEPSLNCDVCKKTFKSLQQLTEHKEQHLETNSDKSDDKSVKSSLSTRDIIHECSLCYMVFPNEHSLTKHSVICQRKKRQSAAKQTKKVEENEAVEEGAPENIISEDKLPETLEPLMEEENILDSSEEKGEQVNLPVTDNTEEVAEVIENHTEEIAMETVDRKEIPFKSDIIVPDNTNTEISVVTLEVPTKSKQIEEKAKHKDVIKVQSTTKKKIFKEKIAPTAAKRKKSCNLSLSVDLSSDEDEIRYMLNPDFKVDTTEGKTFLKVRAKKRNSLQIEKPNSKDLGNRMTSLQRPTMIPRLEPKSVKPKIVPANTHSLKNRPKLSKLEPVPFTDSDDSDVKYSFPKSVIDKTSKPANSMLRDELEETVIVKKEKRKSTIQIRKSLTGIAKRKSLGKAVTTNQKETTSTIRQVKRRGADVEHRCDCGQLFSSAALLSRHTTLAHTPPRIRRRRSPPPEIDTRIQAKKPRKSTTDKLNQSMSRKSSGRSQAGNTTTIPGTSKKIDSVKKEVKIPNTSRISTKSSDKSGDKAKSVKTSAAIVKPKRNAFHRGVPVPEKMKKPLASENSKK